MEELLRKIKTSLRISHTVLDDDILDSINECLRELRTLGVKSSMLDVSQELDPLVRSAVKLYCKATYTDDSAKAQRYMDGYDSLKSFLMMAEDYKEAPGDE